MNNIKIFLFLTLFVFSASIYAQSKDSLVSKTTALKSFTFDFKTKNVSLDFKRMDFSKEKLLFTSYNENTKLNDIYLLNNDDFIYLKSSVLLENNFRGNKIDSFNPHGTNTIGAALIFGLINSILK